MSIASHLFLLKISKTTFKIAADTSPPSVSPQQDPQLPAATLMPLI